MPSGASGVNYNFGNLLPATLSGTVYQDTNGNNLFDAGEPGIAGVTLTLTGTNDQGHSITATTTTAANGTYSFSADSSGNPLRPGTYQIVETQPNGYLAGATAVGTVGGTADGTVVSPGTVGSIVMAEGQSGIHYNFGDFKPVSLSGLVYQDTNGTGVYNSAADPGIAGVVLTLTGTNGLGQSITATATTAANGTYSFTTDSSSNPLRPGTYVITETAPSGYLVGAAALGTVNSVADGTVASPTQFSAIALTSGQSGINYIFSDLQPVGLSGIVYHDANDNGVFDAGDAGLAGVTLTLTGRNGLGQSITATATTGAGGAYSFTTDSSGNALRPGTYQIVETPPSGYVAGTTAVGTVGGTSDGTLVSSTTIGAIGLTSGQSGINYNFGEVKAVALSGLVYHDINGNGVFDAGDAGLAGITMTLTGTNDKGQAVSVTTSTAANGTFSFATDGSGNLLRPGTYVISETPPAGYIAGTTAVGTVGGSTDGTVVTSSQIGAIGLTDGQSGVNYSFGNVQPVSISGLVYQDNNGDDVLDAGDTALAGVTLTLTGTNNLGQAITATTTTAADGTFSFTTDSGALPLRPGTYQIAETLPAGYLAGVNVVGTVGGTTDGTLLPGNAIGAIVLTSGQAGINYTFGAVQPVSISGTVYLDANGNGVYDAGDAPFPAVTLTLTGTNGLGQSVTATAITAADGTYSFTTDSNGNVLLPGTYQVADAVPTGYIADAANVGTVGGVLDGHKASPTELANIWLISGQAGVNYNFGLSLPAAVSGYVYLDNNGTQTFTSGDSVVAGATVQLTGTERQRRQRHADDDDRQQRLLHLFRADRRHLYDHAAGWYADLHAGGRRCGHGQRRQRRHGQRADADRPGAADRRQRRGRLRLRRRLLWRHRGVGRICLR